MFHAILIWVLLTMSYGNFGLQAALADHFAEHEDLTIHAGPTLAGATLHALQCFCSANLAFEFDW